MMWNQACKQQSVRQLARAGIICDHICFSITSQTGLSLVDCYPPLFNLRSFGLYHLYRPPSIVQNDHI